MANSTAHGDKILLHQAWLHGPPPAIWASKCQNSGILPMFVNKVKLLLWFVSVSDRRLVNELSHRLGGSGRSQSETGFPWVSKPSSMRTAAGQIPSLRGSFCPESLPEGRRSSPQPRLRRHVCRLSSGVPVLDYRLFSRHHVRLSNVDFLTGHFLN